MDLVHWCRPTGISANGELKLPLPIATVMVGMPGVDVVLQISLRCHSARQPQWPSLGLHAVLNAGSKTVSPLLLPHGIQRRPNGANGLATLKENR